MKGRKKRIGKKIKEGGREPGVKKRSTASMRKRKKLATNGSRRGSPKKIYSKRGGR